MGLGLIGGSIARGLQSQTPSPTVVAVESKDEIGVRALDVGLVEAVFPSVGDLPEVDLTFLCVPWSALPEVVRDLPPSATSGLLTDVAGVKAPVADLLRRAHPGARFIGSHPMAGGTGGFGASRRDLFRGCPVALCPGPYGEDTSGRSRDIDLLSGIWRSLGANPVLLGAEDHDRAVAYVSHLPFLAAIAQLDLASEDPARGDLAGRGLVAATHHASFPPTSLAEAALENRHLPAAVRKLAARLVELAEACEERPQDLLELAERARRQRDELRRQQGQGDGPTGPGARSDTPR